MPQARRHEKQGRLDGLGLIECRTLMSYVHGYIHLYRNKSAGPPRVLKTPQASRQTTLARVHSF